MSIAYAPGYRLYHDSSGRPPRSVPDLVRLGLVAAILAALVGAGGAVHLLDARSASRLNETMAAPARALLPGGRVETVEVVDAPALIAERRSRVQRTLVTGRTADGHTVHLVIGDYDRTAGVAQSVSWQISGLPLPGGWYPVSSPATYLDQAEQEIDGYRVRLSATASVQGDQVLVVPGRLSVDGTLTSSSQAPAAVRAVVEPMLRPQRVPVPVPAAAASVRSVWFEKDGMGVELLTTEVAAGDAGTGTGTAGGR